MKKIIIVTLFIISLLFNIGCTTLKITPVTTNKIETICISSNPQVFSDFLEALKTELGYYGIKIRVFRNSGFINEWSDDVSKQCEYILTYTARRSWDLALFCRYIELHIYQGNTEIATAIWSTTNSLNLNKYNSTENKIREILKELLINYSYVIDPPKQEMYYYDDWED